MQHRAEHLALDVGDLVDLDERGRDESCRGGALAGSGSCVTAYPRSRIASIWRLMPSRASAVITGPTSVDRRSGLPTRSSAHGAFQHRQHGVGDVLLQAEDAQGGTALAGGIEGGGDHIGRPPAPAAREESTIMRVLPAGLGDQRHRRPPRSAAWRAAAGSAAATAVEPVKITPCDARVGDERRADLARRPAAAAARRRGRRRRAGCGPPRPRSAGFPRPAWRAPHCRLPAPRRPGR